MFGYSIKPKHLKSICQKYIYERPLEWIIHSITIMVYFYLYLCEANMDTSMRPLKVCFWTKADLCLIGICPLNDTF